MAENKNLFILLVKKFPRVEAEKSRAMLAKNLVYLMVLNKELIRYANCPYFFLEYLIHMVNLGTDENMKRKLTNN